MCHEVTCKRCGKPGWVGCGQHVETVLGHVPIEDRCSCAPRHHPHGGGCRIHLHCQLQSVEIKPLETLRPLRLTNRN